MATIEVNLEHTTGLHARTAAQFVKVAQEFSCPITVKNLTNQRGPSNAKSILGLLILGAAPSSVLEISAEGEQADEALEALQLLIDRNFE